MKLSSIFSIVVGIHLLVIASIFILPGCQSKPKTDPADTVLRPTGPEQSSAGRRDVNSAFNAGMTHDSGSPGRVSATTGPRTLSPPTRPVRELESGPARIIGAEPPAREDTYTPAPEPVIGPAPARVREPASTPARPAATYEVRAGDNLTVIARRHGVTLAELLEANGLSKDAVLQIGQVLTLPAARELSGPDQPPVADYTAVDVGDGGQVYTVARGDTLSGLATRYRTTVAALRAANNLGTDRIRVDQELLIPPPSGQPQLTRFDSGRAQSASTTERPAPARENGEISYEVRSGDTLGAIANRFDVTVRNIMERNAITDPRRLRAGQQLVIPTGLQPVPAAPAPRDSEQAADDNRAQPEAAVREVFDFDDLEDIPEVPVQESD